jgi:hypothetical protein
MITYLLDLLHDSKVKRTRNEFGALFDNPLDLLLEGDEVGGSILVLLKVEFGFRYLGHYGCH